MGRMLLKSIDSVRIFPMSARKKSSCREAHGDMGAGEKESTATDSEEESSVMHDV